MHPALPSPLGEAGGQAGCQSSRWQHAFETPERPWRSLDDDFTRRHPTLLHGINHPPLLLLIQACSEIRARQDEQQESSSGRRYGPSPRPCAPHPGEQVGAAGGTRVGQQGSCMHSLGVSQHGTMLQPCAQSTQSSSCAPLNSSVLLTMVRMRSRVPSAFWLATDCRPAATDSECDTPDGSADTCRGARGGQVSSWWQHEVPRLSLAAGRAAGVPPPPAPPAGAHRAAALGGTAWWPSWSTAGMLSVLWGGGHGPTAEPGALAAPTAHGRRCGAAPRS